jgi:transitional endoplasmic reticulum ATPase
MAANDRAIKVAELKPGEAGKGVARLDPALMGILGIKVGDIAIVTGTKRTAVKILRGAPEDENRGIIRLDGSTRRNAGVSIDERVDVKKAETKEAEKITFAPTDELRLQGGGGVPCAGTRGQGVRQRRCAVPEHHGQQDGPRGHVLRPGR